MRALLDLMRENEGVEKFSVFFASVLVSGSADLTSLDPEVGEEDLIQAVAAELAKLRALSRSV